MRGFLGLITNFSMPRLSRWLIVTSVALLTAWLQAHLLLAVLHDDGSTVRNAITVYDDPAVRSQVSGGVDWLLDQGVAVSGAAEVIVPVQQQLRAVLAGGRIPPAAADAITVALVTMRDDALSQFESSAPTRALVIELGPVLTGFGIALPPEAGQLIGISGQFAVPIADAASMEAWRTKYHWTTIIDRWGLLAGAVAGVVGIVLARRPLRAFAGWLVVGGAAALLAIPLFGVLHDWLLAGGAGPWTPLVAPLVTSTLSEVSPWLLPLGIAAVLAGAGLGGWLILRGRRSAAIGATEAPTEPGRSVHDAAETVGDGQPAAAG
ncbi:hypothetical protein IF188_04540 [Microbacterium sp. NEAU-LLC]|uniref:DUF3533 domain-containing protein n=1 Tax=Microbacterium helvum TaxID=2773713 RepID=A0ABR8NN85_9MICO|nr:hypothetical protein [Microbacterium helvum]MBD3940971.1 hypothetical protein [Microbacterium helvum]